LVIPIVSIIGQRRNCLPCLHIEVCATPVECFDTLLEIYNPILLFIKMLFQNLEYCI